MAKVSESYRVLALKYRPQSFDDVVGQKHVTQTLANAIAVDRVAHAYLFCGPRGVGKTTAARILAKALNCEQGPTATPCNVCTPCLDITGGRSLDVLEIDGASNRGINEVRELRENVRYAPSGMRYKVYIIDEVHMLTTEAFNALLKTLEEPPKHVIFVFATTEPFKVPGTILSRCQRFDFARIPAREITARLTEVIARENRAIDEQNKAAGEKTSHVEVTPEALALVARRAAGGLRDALSLMDQIISAADGPVDRAIVERTLGLVGSDFCFVLGDLLADGRRRRSVAAPRRGLRQGRRPGRSRREPDLASARPAPPAHRPRAGLHPGHPGVGDPALSRPGREVLRARRWWRWWIAPPRPRCPCGAAIIRG